MVLDYSSSGRRFLRHLDKIVDMAPADEPPLFPGANTITIYCFAKKKLQTGTNNCLHPCSHLALYRQAYTFICAYVYVHIYITSLCTCIFECVYLGEFN